MRDATTARLIGVTSVCRIAISMEMLQIDQSKGYGRIHKTTILTSKIPMADVRPRIHASSDSPTGRGHVQFRTTAANVKYSQHDWWGVRPATAKDPLPFLTCDDYVFFYTNDYASAVAAASALRTLALACGAKEQAITIPPVGEEL